jgi:beta-glucosidase
MKSLALIGPGEGTPMPAGFGAMHVRPSRPVSALAALRGVMGNRVRYNDGGDISDAVQLAASSEAAVVVVHDVQTERHDRTSLALPGNQDALVSAVAAANRHTIVVLETGSGVLMPWLNSVSSVLETWYPGEQAGPSLVDLLSGRANPSGKLPVTFPASAAAMPANTAATFGGLHGRTVYEEGLNVGYRWYDSQQVTPAFTFGYGLSYTHFRFADLRTTPGAAGGMSVTATITNIGHAAGADVAQCYLGYPGTSGEPPRQLRSFVRVQLKPGQTKTVRFDLSAGDLSHWDSSSQRWVVDPGTYQVWVGDGSDPSSLPLTTTLNVDGATLEASSGPVGGAAATAA